MKKDSNEIELMKKWQMIATQQDSVKSFGYEFWMKKLKVALKILKFRNSFGFERKHKISKRFQEKADDRRTVNATNIVRRFLARV